MSVSSRDEAPANIQALDGADLTLDQINYILEIYDALAEAGEVDEPMAAAIAQFRATYHRENGRWRRNEARLAAQASVRVLANAAVSPVDGAQGREWEVVIIGPERPADVVVIEGQDALRSKNGGLYLLSALEASVPIWDGVKVYDNHLTDEELLERQGMRSVAQEWMGTLVDPFWDAGRRQVRATLKIVEEALSRKLLNAYEQDVLRSIGLSIDAFAEGRVVEFEGTKVVLYEVLVEAISVDVVGDPAAGGRFERLLACAQAASVGHDGDGQVSDSGGNEMDEELREQIESMIAEAVAGLGAGIREQVEAAISEQLEAREGEDADAEEPEEPGDEGGEEEPEELDEESDEDEAVEEARQILQEARQIAEELTRSARVQQCQATLETALASSGLPDEFRDLVRERFAGRVFEAEMLENEIESQRRALLRISESGRVQGLGQMLTPAGGGVAPADRFLYRALATFRMRDEIPEDYRSRDATPAWRGLRDMYVALTGDHEFYGRYCGERVTEANVTSSTMASTVANVMNKLLVNAYYKREQWWEPIVSNRDLDEFQDMRMVSLYGFSTLSTVGEGAAYTELTWDDYYETASISKKGNYVGITLEMMMKDDLDTVRTIPQGLGAAAYNTVADLVSAVFTANAGAGPSMTATSRNLFNGTDGNLLTTALSFSGFDSAAQTLMDIAEPGSSRALGLMPGYLLVPTELYTLGRQIRNSQLEPETGNNEVNPWYEQFDVVRVPTWTDADNWSLIAKPQQFEGIVLGWLFGRREPEIYVADNELAGAMFTNDEMRVKIRFFTCLGVTDWRFGVKSNV